MTDEQKIERLAKWMGATTKRDPHRRQLYILGILGGVWKAKSHGDDKSRDVEWDPLTNIADAWMLVEMAQHNWLDAGEEWNALDNIAEHVFALSGEEAAAAISDAVLEVIA